MRSLRIAVGVLLAMGAAYSLYAGNTTLVIFFTSLFVVALLAPGLISRTSEVSLGDFRLSFKKRVDMMPDLSDEARAELKKRIDAAESLDDALDVFVSLSAGRLNKGE